MAIIRSRSAPAGTAQLQNAEVERALVQWQDRVSASFEEGRQQGIRESKELHAEVAEKISEIQKSTQQEIAAKEKDWNQRWSQLIVSFQEALGEVSHLEKQALQSAEALLIDLAVDLSGKICHQHMQVNPQWMQEIIIAAMKDVPDKRDLCIRMNPQDAQEAQRVVAMVQEGMDEQIDIDIREDQQLAPGSLMMESQGTYINAGIPATWKRLGEDLRALAPSSDWSAFAVIGPDENNSSSPSSSTPSPAPTAMPPKSELIDPASDQGADS